jgi:Kef-type K+ transport system membrane component KefB
MELRLLHERVGETIVSAAIFDDMIGLVLLAVVLSVIETGAAPETSVMLILLGKVALFFVVTIAAGLFLGPPFYRVVARFRIPAPRFSALMSMALGFAVLAEALGMDFILGPFLAGLFFKAKTVGEKPYAAVENSLKEVTDGLLAPLFFVSIGARVDLAAVQAIPVFLAALLAVAFLGKLIGAGVPARLAGLSPRDAAAVGIGMSDRGAVTLVVASIALQAGLFDQPHELVANLFSALVIIAAVTAMVMPVALRAVLRTKTPPRDDNPEDQPSTRPTAR